jgi:hypothetical protein
VAVATIIWVFELSKAVSKRVSDALNLLQIQKHLNFFRKLKNTENIMTTLTLSSAVENKTLGNLFPKTTAATPAVPALKTIAIDGGKSSLVNPFAPSIDMRDSSVAIDNATSMYKSYIFQVVFKGEEPAVAAANIIALNPTCGVRVLYGKFPSRKTLIGALKRMLERFATDRILTFSAPLPHGQVLEAFALYVATTDFKIA